MIRRPLATAALFCLAALLGSYAQAQDEKPLFNGKNLEGWEHVGPGRFVVEDGQLKTEGGMGLLWFSGEKLGDCVIRVVYKTATPRANSGVYVRIAEKPSDPWYAVHNGFEVQIADNDSSTRGTGSVYTFSETKARPSKPGEWNTMEITLKGSKILTKINGVDVTEFDSATLDPNAKPVTGEVDPSRTPRPNKGYIGLQNHDADSIVFFKEITVRPLKAE